MKTEKVTTSWPFTSPWPLRLLVALLFVQLWFDIAGITVRLEDVVLLGWLGVWMVLTWPALWPLFYKSPLDRPLIAWGIIILISVAVTFLRPYIFRVQKDAVINGGRLILALAVFFVVYHHQLPAAAKVRLFIRTVLAVSLLTTAVTLLQIASWANWLPFPLPAFLTTIRPEASDDFGKEIFGLFVGNTAGHAWSTMVALQALVVWCTVWQLWNCSVSSFQYSVVSKRWLLALGLGYLAVLGLILVRISVRNSILGLVVAIVGLHIAQWFTSSRLTWSQRCGRLALTGGAAVGILLLLSYLAPENYFLIRLWQALPTIENGQLAIRSGANISGRVEMARVGWQIFRQAPLFGAGYWSYAILAPSFTDYTWYMAHAHNSFVQALAETGVLGTTVFLWLFGTIAWQLFKQRPLVTQTAAGQLLWNITVAYAIFLLFTSFFAIPLWQPGQIIPLMFLLGTLFSLVREQTDE